MKRFIAVLSGLLVLPAFAEVAPIYYDEEIELTDDGYIQFDEQYEEIAPNQANTQPAPHPTVAPAVVATPTARATRNAGRNTTTATRTVSSGSTNVSTRGTSPRTVGTRTATVTARGTTAGTGTVSTRAASSTRTTRPTSAARSATTTNSGTTTATRRNTATSTGGNVAARASIIQSNTVTAPLYTGRVGVRGTSASIGARVPSIQMGTTTDSGTATTTSATSMDELAQITDFCKAQYTQCMDNFCNVLDDNQGRCSCSANLANYEKTEQALKNATEELQNVAQNMRYIGLTATQVESLFQATEAELQLSSSTDSSQLKNNLDKIKGMIIDVNTGTASSSTSGVSTDLSGLLNFSLDSTGFNLANINAGSILNTSATNSISNQRGTQLYKTATARCKASVLNSCQAQGVDISIITNAYDLEIDKQCIAYERSLNESNAQMSSMVSNAKVLLQNARLQVSQQKNAYNLRECVTELDKCMQEDFVCGTNYENCLDPTGKFIVAGEVVAGSLPGTPGQNSSYTGTIYDTWTYDSKNAWDNGTLSDYINKYVNGTFPETADSTMANFLQQKIGRINNDGKAEGMCASVLNMCQDYSFTNNKYKTDNQVIKNYMERVLPQIKSAQDTTLSDYAETCVSDVVTCLNRNSTTYGYNSSYSYNTANPSNAAINACKSVISTCMSVNGIEKDKISTKINEWLDDAVNTSLTTKKRNCVSSNGTWNGSVLDGKGLCTCPNGTELTNDGLCQKKPATPPTE